MAFLGSHAAPAASLGKDHPKHMQVRILVAVRHQGEVQLWELAHYSNTVHYHHVEIQALLVHELIELQNQWLDADCRHVDAVARREALDSEHRGELRLQPGGDLCLHLEQHHLVAFLALRRLYLSSPQGGWATVWRAWHDHGAWPGLSGADARAPVLVLGTTALPCLLAAHWRRFVTAWAIRPPWLMVHARRRLMRGPAVRVARAAHAGRHSHSHAWIHPAPAVFHEVVHRFLEGNAIARRSMHVVVLLHSPGVASLPVHALGHGHRIMRRIAFREVTRSSSTPVRSALSGERVPWTTASLRTATGIWAAVMPIAAVLTPHRVHEGIGLHPGVRTLAPVRAGAMPILRSRVREPFLARMEPLGLLLSHLVLGKCRLKAADAHSVRVGHFAAFAVGAHACEQGMTASTNS
mmetsp:Transcript_8801/g.25349  ORF Transcript_8801/g.25349 Transcript_8801/m.25349 type:complete len:409 (-) Transcript_8801:1831-3057(-)